MPRGRPVEQGPGLEAARGPCSRDGPFPRRGDCYSFGPSFSSGHVRVFPGPRQRPPLHAHVPRAQRPDQCQHSRQGPRGRLPRCHPRVGGTLTSWGLARGTPEGCGRLQVGRPRPWALAQRRPLFLSLFGSGGRGSEWLGRRPEPPVGRGRAATPTQGLVLPHVLPRPVRSVWSAAHPSPLCAPLPPAGPYVLDRNARGDLGPCARSRVCGGRTARWPAERAEQQRCCRRPQGLAARRGGRHLPREVTRSPSRGRKQGQSRKAPWRWPLGTKP